jgi:hypothetical protein
MGRPLKIKKTLTKDIGFNPFSQLTNPVFPVTMTTTDFFGVVGGANAEAGSSVATAGNPVVKCRVFIPGAGSEDDGYIITQKGTIRYQVAAVTAVNDEDLVIGSAYRILTVGTTNWTACGASKTNPQAGDVFTATAVGAGTGTAQLVGICTLANEVTGALTEGNMNITLQAGGDSTEILISRLTNRFALDYATPPVRYATNFFTDEGTSIKSGTVAQTLDLGQVDSYTS